MANFTVESVQNTEQITPITELRTTELLHELGVPAHIKGYLYSRRAIVLAVEDDAMLDSITRKLYPTIADEFKTTPSRVERAIRHAVEVGYIRGHLKLCEKLFSYSISPNKDKPTNPPNRNRSRRFQKLPRYSQAAFHASIKPIKSPRPVYFRQQI
ncbi:MAG: sporulation initiation factor Spo0A C-terminal domain-containing protein [Candidatus Nomurabacteria bacterium]|nr:sporulation initiation factor Spo0A C-terminal domain-containing protein [Candidatus Nomurabacteria bacterium]